MSWLDRWAEEAARRAARGVSRRHLLARLGAALVGGAALPLLPVSRLATAAAGAQETAAAGAQEGGARPAAPSDEGLEGASADPASCDYWRHCAIDGFLCSCCGGSHTACPPGTTMAPVTWIGTCRHPGDGRDYIISYNDCCGRDYCGRCMCNRNEGDRPIYMPQKSNDLNWCVAAESTVYHCSTAIVLGVAVATDASGDEAS
jgi:methylamine dehydrogenase light chain